MYPTVYIADNSLESAKSLAAFLVGKGFPLENIVSSWVFEAGSEFGAPKSNARRAEIAASCLKDIDRASILVFTGNQKNYGKGGKNVELGYALGRGKTVIICGHYENTMHYCLDIVRVGTKEELAALLMSGDALS